MASSKTVTYTSYVLSLPRIPLLCRLLLCSFCASNQSIRPGHSHPNFPPTPSLQRSLFPPQRTLLTFLSSTVPCLEKKFISSQKNISILFVSLRTLFSYNSHRRWKGREVLAHSLNLIAIHVGCIIAGSLQSAPTFQAQTRPFLILESSS